MGKLMTRDILAETDYLFLGSRLKRLAERLQSDAARLIAEAGFSVQPAHFPLLAAVDRYGPLSVNEASQALGVSQPSLTRTAQSLIDMGLLSASRTDGDLRQKTLSLSAHGSREVARAKAIFWPRVNAGARALCEEITGDFLGQVSLVEAALDRASLEKRVSDIAPPLSIRPYEDGLAEAFQRITEEWITSMFTMEANDRKILSNPRSMIIDRGGIILFVEAAGLGIVGTCALIRIEDGVFELTKMGVLAAARGLKAGEFLLAAIVQRARDMQIRKLYLLTSSKCEAAIHLYEKLGFIHDADIMKDYGARYKRCNVAMSFPF